MRRQNKKAAAMKKKRAQKKQQEDQQKTKQEEVPEVEKPKAVVVKTEEKKNEIYECFKDIILFAKMAFGNDKLERQLEELNSRIEKNPDKAEIFTLETEIGDFVLETVPYDGNDSDTENDSQEGEEIERGKDEQALLSYLDSVIEEAEMIQNRLINRMKQIERFTSFQIPFKRLWENFFP